MFRTSLLLALALPASALAAPPELVRVAITPDDDTTTNNVVLTFEPGELPDDWASFAASATVTDASGAPVGLVTSFITPQVRRNGRYRTQARLVGLDASVQSAVVTLVASHGGGTTEASLLVPVGDANMDGLHVARVSENAAGELRVVTRTVTEGVPAASLSTVVVTQDGSPLYESLVTTSRTQYSLCAVASFAGEPADGVYPVTTSLYAGPELLDAVTGQSVTADEDGLPQWQVATTSGGEARLRFATLGDGLASVCVDVRDGDADRVDSVDVSFLDTFVGPAPAATTLTLVPSAIVERFVDAGAGELAAAGNVVEQALLDSTGAVIEEWTWTGGPEARTAQRTHPTGLRLGITKGWEK